MKKLLVILAIVLMIFGCAINPKPPPVEISKPVIGPEITPQEVFKWEPVGQREAANSVVLFFARVNGAIQIAYLGGAIVGDGFVCSEFGYLKDGKMISFVYSRAEGRLVPYEYPKSIREYAVAEMSDLLKNFLYNNGA